VPEDLEVRAVNERVREDPGLPGIKRARDPEGWQLGGLKLLGQTA
jgi:hypothetical protein